MIVAGIVVALRAAALFLWAEPITKHGRRARSLLAANAAGWLSGLALAAAGYRSHAFYLLVLFGFLNLLLLPAASIMLWVCHRDAAERESYLAAAAAYVAANVLALYVVPPAWAYLR